MFNLRELRNLMTEALGIANDLDQNVPPELRPGLEHMRDLLDCALERMDGTMGQNRVWPDLAARA
jgi:hypothetical protein